MTYSEKKNLRKQALKELRGKEILTPLPQEKRPNQPPKRKEPQQKSDALIATEAENATDAQEQDMKNAMNTTLIEMDVVADVITKEYSRADPVGDLENANIVKEKDINKTIKTKTVSVFLIFEELSDTIKQKN